MKLITVNGCILLSVYICFSFVIVSGNTTLSAGKGPIGPQSDDDKEGIEGIEGKEEVKDETEDVDGIEKSKPSITV